MNAAELAARMGTDVPASVEYLSASRAIVRHPAGAQHENFRLTVERLRGKGLTVVTETRKVPA
jgi:hypothetical protein